MSTPEQRHPSNGSPRAFTNEDGYIFIEWPDPKPEYFEISSHLFETLVAELNAGRKLSDTVDELGDAIIEARAAAGEMDDASARAHA